MQLKNLLGSFILLPAIVSAQFACIAIVTTSINYEPAYSTAANGQACPAPYYLPNGVSNACCASTQQVATFSGGSVACCRCGAFCTGTAPALLALGGGGSASATASVSVSTSQPIFIPSGVTLTTPSPTSRSGTGVVTITTTPGSSQTSTRPTASSSSGSSSAPAVTQTGSGADASAVVPGSLVSGLLFVVALARGVFVL